MILDKVLILKGLAGVTALGGTIAAAWYGISSLGGDSDAKELKKSLGIPSDCKLPTSNNSPANCELDADKLKAIKFNGKGGGNVTIPNNGTVTLIITKVESSDSIFGAGGYKFAFNSTEDLSIPKSTSGESISIKKGTNTEFKIKETPSTTDGSTTKTLSLEKAWNITEWGKKIGLTNCTTTGSTKECTLPTDHNLNVAFSSSDKSTTTIKEDSRSKKLKYEEDAAEHNQGFKFTADNEICLTSGSETKKIEASTNSGTPTYEIKEIEGKWYLAKKTTGQGNS